MNSSKPTDSQQCFLVQQASLPSAEVQLGTVAPVAPDARHRRNCLFRKAAADEFGRAASLCPSPPARPGEGPLRCFVAVRTRPVERLLAAAFWKRVPETHGDITAEIQWTALPALGGEIPAFLEALIANITVEDPGVSSVASADWFPAGHPAAAVLQSVGFSISGTQTFFHADATAWRDALGLVLPTEEHPEIVPLHPNHFDRLSTLLCGASLRPSELSHGFHTAFSESPSLFDPRCSGVIIADGEISAACLANASHGHLTLAALAGPEATCNHLLHHSLQGRDGLAEPVTLSFHLDDRDPPSALAALLERLPHQSAGQLTRYARLLAASEPSAASPLSHLRHPHSADSETKTHIEKRKPHL